MLFIRSVEGCLFEFNLTGQEAVDFTENEIFLV